MLDPLTHSSQLIHACHCAGLWRSVDTWGLGWDRKIAAVVSGRCSELEELMARGAVAALACIHLKVSPLSMPPYLILLPSDLIRAL